MVIEDQQAKLMAEAQALKYFFKAESAALKHAFEDFAELYEAERDIDSDEFYAALNAIEAELEDLCLSQGIAQESLESYMLVDVAYQQVEL